MRLETLLIQTDTLSGTKSRALPQLHWLASPTRENTARRWAAVPLTGHREKWQGQRLVKVFSFIKNWQLHLSFSKLGKFLWFGCGFGFFFLFSCAIGYFWVSELWKQKQAATTKQLSRQQAERTGYLFAMRSSFLRRTDQASAIPSACVRSRKCLPEAHFRWMS